MESYFALAAASRGPRPAAARSMVSFFRQCGDRTTSAALFLAESLKNRSEYGFMDISTMQMLQAAGNLPTNHPADYFFGRGGLPCSGQKNEYREHKPAPRFPGGNLPQKKIKNIIYTITTRTTANEKTWADAE